MSAVQSSLQTDRSHLVESGSFLTLHYRMAGAVQFDFNHPLAGQPVVFEMQLIGVL